MAHRQSSHIHRALTRLLPGRRIRELARRLAVVRRRRKVDIVSFVYALVLGFADGDRRTLSGLRRAYVRATGTRLAPSSFHARFCTGMVELMRTVALEALDELARTRPRLRGVFAPFREVLAIDSALLRLHDALEPFYPSVFTNHMKASAKLTVVMNVIGRGAKTVKLSHGSCHDVHLIEVGRWMKGKLLLFDLGFFRVPLFLEINRQQGYFLSRARKWANPTITWCRRPSDRRLVGMKLQDALPLVEGHILDVEGEMGYMLRHRQRPLVTTHRASFRFVAVYNHELSRWHCYVTNLPASIMKAEHFSAVYAARWEVELLFRELKGSYRIENMPSANKHVTETLIYAALLTLAVSRKLHRTVTHRFALDPTRLPFDRWAVLVATLSHDLLDLALARRDRPYRERRIERVLRAEATDPNRARNHLPDKAQQGIYQRA